MHKGVVFYMRLGLHKHRIRIFSCKNRKAVTVCLILILTMLIAIYAAVFFVLRVKPIFLSHADSYANIAASKAINDSLNEIFSREFISYKDLVTINTDSNGNVVSLEANAAKINYLKSKVANTIQETITKNDSGKISIPLGSVLNSEVLQGFGPRISIKVAPIGVVKVDFADEFISSGINQVRHKIYLDAEVTVTIVSATMDKEETVTNRVLVAETIIVGNIPKYYSENTPMNAVIERTEQTGD